MSELFKLKNIKKDFSVIVNKTQTVAEVLLYGAVGDSMWDDNAVSANKFVDELNKLPSSVTEIQLRINSPGGSVFDGITMYERLKQHKAKVITYVDGVAASIASIIAMAGDEINIGEGSFFMIHKPMSATYGNSDDHEKTINILDKIEEQMISIYARKTGLSRLEISKMLMKDTWINSDEALSMGFATTKIEASEQLLVAASMLKEAKWIVNPPSINTDLMRNKISEIQNKYNKFLAR